MITVLLCECGNSEPLARKVMREAHYPNWLTQPVIKGKNKCLSYLSSLPEGLETGSLMMFIRRNSSWAVFLEDDPFQWVDVGHGHLKEKLDAEIMLERYKKGE